MESFFNNFVGWRSETLLKRDSSTLLLSCTIHNTYFVGHLQTAAFATDIGAKYYHQPTISQKDSEPNPLHPLINFADCQNMCSF